MMRKVFVTGLALTATIGVHSITIDDWCPPVAEAEPQECVYQSTGWSCAVELNHAWCCVTKTMLYNCDSGPVNRTFQWNKSNSTACINQNMACRNY